MQLTINPIAVDDCLKSDIDITSFLDLLISRETSGPHFDRCHVDSHWGLLIFTFSRVSGTAICPVNLDVLLVTAGTVINDAGQVVPRWSRLCDELLKWADERAKPSGIVLARPG